MNNLHNIIEAILFVSGDAIEISYIAEKLETDKKTVEKAVDELAKKYSPESGIKLLKFNNKVQLASNPEYSTQVETLLNPIKEKALTKATLETVAIIAYKQPITRLEIEQIRTKNSDYAIQVLIENKMIEVVGRKDALGKPLLFGTTDEFLKRFDLSSVDELPDYNELIERIKVIQDETDSLYNTYGLNPDEEATSEEGAENTAPEEEIPDFLKDEKDIVSIN